MATTKTKAAKAAKPVDMPGLDRNPDVTTWLAKWANLTATLRVLAEESSMLACAVRPGAFAYQPKLEALGIDLDRVNDIESKFLHLAGSMIEPPFRGTLACVGDGTLEAEAK